MANRNIDEKQIIWIDAAHALWGKQCIDNAYPGKDGRRQMKKIVKRWWAQRRAIKAMVLSGKGDVGGWAKGGQKPSNPYEELISQQLRKMAAVRIAIGPHLITHVASSISASNGMQIRLQSRSDKVDVQTIGKMLQTEMFNDIKDIVAESAETNKDGPVFIPSDKWRHGFTKRWNLKWGKVKKTECDLFGLLSNLEPALEYLWLE
eukprot:767120_1